MLSVLAATIDITQPTPIAQQHPVETWAAFIGSISLIGLLVAVLYKRLNSDIKEHTDALKEGTKRFEEICKVIATINEQLRTIERELKEIFGIIEEGRRTIEGIKRDAVAVEQRIDNLKNEDDFEMQELDRLTADTKDVDRRLLTIETEHKKCQDMLYKERITQRQQQQMATQLQQQFYKADDRG